jgi:hypothetical protein
MRFGGVWNSGKEKNTFIFSALTINAKLPDNTLTVDDININSLFQTLNGKLCSKEQDKYEKYTHKSGSRSLTKKSKQF